MSEIMQLKISQIKKLAPQLIRAGTSIELIGASGTGKTSIIQQIVEECTKLFGVQGGFASINCATALPITVPGFPLFTGRNDRGTRTTEHTEPVWTTCRDGKSVYDYQWGILCLDEIRSAEGDIKKQLADLQLTGGSGNHHLPNFGGKNGNVGWVTWATGNRVTDRSGVTKDFDFRINRRLEIHLRPDIEDVVDYFAEIGVHPAEIAFYMQNPQVIIHDAAPETQGPWCTPRSAELLDRVLKQFIDPANPEVIPYSPELMALASGLVGPGTANQLATFLKMANSSIKFQDIVNDPANCKLPDRPDMMMLICYSAASRVDAKNFKPVIQYISRLPEEFAVMFARASLKRDNKLINTQAMGDWCSKNASLLAVVTSLG